MKNKLDTSNIQINPNVPTLRNRRSKQNIIRNVRN